jgi:hypothetical protein
MKTSIKIIGMLAIVMTMLFGCDKAETVKEESKDQKFSVAIKVANAKGEVENGLMIGTSKELETALSGDKDMVYLKRASKANNLFTPVVGTVTDGPVTDVFEVCWDEITAYYNEHRPQWLAAANQSCEDVIVCLTCPNSGGGLYVLYVIKPTARKCLEVADISLTERYKFAKFGFEVADYESAKVRDFINK